MLFLCTHFDEGAKGLADNLPHCQTWICAVIVMLSYYSWVCSFSGMATSVSVSASVSK